MCCRKFGSLRGRGESQLPEFCTSARLLGRGPICGQAEEQHQHQNPRQERPARGHQMDWVVCLVSETVPAKANLAIHHADHLLVTGFGRALEQLIAAASCLKCVRQRVQRQKLDSHLDIA